MEPVKYEEAAIYAVNQRIPNICRIAGAALQRSNSQESFIPGLFESCSIHKEDVSVLEEGFDRKAREHQVKRFAELFDVPLSKEEERYLIDVKKPEKLSFLSGGDRDNLEKSRNRREDFPGFRLQNPV